MLRDNALYFRVAFCDDGLVAAVPAGYPAGCIRPHHMDLGTAILCIQGIVVLDKLVIHHLLNTAVPPEFQGRIKDGPYG